MRSLFLSILAIVALSMPVNLLSRDHIDRLPAMSVIERGYFHRDSVVMRLDRLPLHSIEGIWRFPSNGAEIVIERVEITASPTSTDAIHYRMIVIDSPNRSLLPGTVMGYISPTAKRGSYAARIYTSGDGGSVLYKPKRFTLTLADGLLTFHQHGIKMRVNLWRLLPYMSRIGLRWTNDTPDDIDGCQRIYPEPDVPLNPRYL